MVLEIAENSESIAIRNEKPRPTEIFFDCVFFARDLSNINVN